MIILVIVFCITISIVICLSFYLYKASLKAKQSKTSIFIQNNGVSADLRKKPTKLIGSIFDEERDI